MRIPPFPAPVAQVGAELGEGPAWDMARQCLWFVDIKGALLHCFTPTTGALASWPAPGPIGWALPARDGSLVAGLRGALHLFTPADARFQHLLAVESDLPGNRLNDATTAADGSIWFGTMDDAERAITGRIYRFVAGTMSECGLAPVCITNGPALSPDGRTLYHTDTLGRRILASSLAADGMVRGTHVFATIEEGAGFPDGPTVDAEGCLWTGLFGGWAVRRYAPDGRLLLQIPFPVANVTKLAFGGPDLRTVYATTARKGLSEQDLAYQPLAGDLFAFRAPAAGLPLPAARV